MTNHDMHYQLICDAWRLLKDGRAAHTQDDLNAIVERDIDLEHKYRGTDIEVLSVDILSAVLRELQRIGHIPAQNSHEPQEGP